MKIFLFIIAIIISSFILSFFLIFKSSGGPGFKCLSGNCENGYGEALIGAYDHKIKGLIKNKLLIKGIYSPHKNCIIKGEFVSYKYYRTYKNGLIAEEDCNGVKREGYFDLGLAKGHGTITFADGKSFSGDWKSNGTTLSESTCVIGDCFNGYGLLVGANAYSFGEFKEGQLHGKVLNESNISNEYYKVYIGDLNIDIDGIQIGEKERKKSW